VATIYFPSASILINHVSIVPPYQQMETEYTCFDVIILQLIKNFSPHNPDSIDLVELSVFLQIPG